MKWKSNFISVGDSRLSWNKLRLLKFTVMTSFMSQQRERGRFIHFFIYLGILGNIAVSLPDELLDHGSQHNR